MSEVKKVSTYEENYSQNEENQFEEVEEIVNDIVSNGLPNVYSPSMMISKIAQQYGISQREARSCLNLASKQIEAEKKASDNDAPYEQTSYYYANGYTKNKQDKNDGMDSLSCLSNYNRLMFGV